MFVVTHRSFLVPEELEKELVPANLTVAQALIKCLDDQETRIRQKEAPGHLLYRADVSFLEALAAVARVVPVSPQAVILHPDPTIEPDAVYNSAVAMSPLQALDVRELSSKLNSLPVPSRNEAAADTPPIVEEDWNDLYAE